MTDDVTNAAPGRPPGSASSGMAPPIRAWLSGMSERVRDALTDSRMLALMILANLVTLLGAGGIWLALDGDATVVGVTAGALLTFVAAMLPLIKGKDEGVERSLWPPLVLVVIPCAVLIVGLAALGVWAYLDSRPVDMTHRFELDPDRPLQGGETVVASAHTNDAKARLTITFDLAQHDLAEPVCYPDSELTVALRAGAAHNSPQTQSAGHEFSFDLGKGLEDIKLDIQLTQLTAEPNCELDLSIKSAYLDD